jgi:uncharacterized protein YkwD
MRNDPRTDARVHHRIGRAAVAATLVVALTTSAVLSSTAVVAGAAATTAVRPAQSLGDFLGAINDLRVSLGLGGLTTSAELNAVAQRWSDQMAAAGGISHNPNLGGQVSGGWKLLGENVGVGWDVIGLMAAFIASPSHYVNLVNPVFNYVGVGNTWTSDGRLFTTHVFMQKSSAAAPPAVIAPTPTPSRPVPLPTVEPAPPVAPVVVPAEPPAPRPSPTPARVATLLGALRALDPTAT